MYFKSRTDLDIVQVPTLFMGPAGFVVEDPDFLNLIVRATDENTSNGLSYGAGIDGSADVNIWNTNSTMLYLHDSGGAGAIFGFDPSSMAVKRLFPGWRVPNALLWSRLDPNIAFNFVGTQFLRYDLSDTSLNVPPPPTLVCDFAGQLPGLYTWNTVGGVEAGDTVFTAAFSVSGPQGTGVCACAYFVGQGFRTLHTDIGFITGDFGPVGVISIPDRFTIHNVKSSKDGLTLVIGMTQETVGTDKGPMFWTMASTAVSPMSTIGQGGHWTAGYGEFFNNASTKTIAQWAHDRRFLSDLDHPWQLALHSPDPQLMFQIDDHPSFNGPQNSMLATVTTTTPDKTPGPFETAWRDEVLGFDLDGSGRVYRFCHHFSNTHSGNFNADNAIGCVDQLNTFVAFTSNWQSSLANGRYDAFIVKLR